MQQLAEREGLDIVKIAAIVFEPYAGELMENGGYLPSLVDEIFRSAGYSVEIRFYPPNRAKYLCESGQAHMILPLFKGEISEKAFLLSDPLPGGSISLLKRVGSEIPVPELKAWESQEELFSSLSAYRFGVRSNTLMTDVFDSSEFLDKEYSHTDRQNLEKLFYDRIDFLVMDRFTAAYSMATDLSYLIGQIEVLDPPLEKRDFYIGFSRKIANSPTLMDIINKGLTEWRQTGRLEQILSRQGLAGLIDQKNKSDVLSLTIASVDNRDMMLMKDLASEYLADKPYLDMEWRFMDENTLRTRLLSDMAIGEGIFDIMTIGSYEAPIWAENKWIIPQKNLPAAYDEEDLLGPIVDSLSYNDQLYALPFYAESSMLYYRKDLFEEAGLVMPDKPTWQDIEVLASKLHNREKGIYGIVLRGKPGWGENLTVITTMVNSFGGKWFDSQGNPALDGSEWRDAVTFYSSLLRNYGQPEPWTYGYKESLNLFSQGQAAIWVDATVAAGYLYDREVSVVADKISFSEAPYALYEEGKSWLWTWALAVPETSLHKEEAMNFIQWATSKEYGLKIANAFGWSAVPAGTRHSTYANEDYLEAADFATHVIQAIESSDPSPSSAKPYKGIQYVVWPGFSTMAGKVSREIAEVLMGTQNVDEALSKSQEIARDYVQKDELYK